MVPGKNYINSEPFFLKLEGMLLLSLIYISSNNYEDTNLEVKYV